MEGRDFGKRALQRVKNYEKGQYTYKVIFSYLTLIFFLALFIDLQILTYISVHMSM